MCDSNNLSTQEMRVRKAASKTLESFEAELQEELAGMIHALEEEKEEKLRAAAAFHCEIELRIQEMQGVLSQLGRKVEGVTALYGTTIEEVRRYVTTLFYSNASYVFIYKCTVAI